MLTESDFSDRTVYGVAVVGYMIDNDGLYHPYVHQSDRDDFVYMVTYDNPEDAMKEAVKILAEQHRVVIEANLRGIVML